MNTDKASWEFQRAAPFSNEYRLGVVDGDTIYFKLDLGFYLRKVETIRLGNVDTHEIHFVDHDSEEYEKGIEERDFVQAWLQEGIANYDGMGWPFKVLTTDYDPTGKYGRTIGYIQRKSDKEILNERLLEEFDGIEY